ncbi:hypothetical protein [Vibrio fluvialis]|uniref:hypothetical protein n=1 Tax=Vibrio fluvialis TaxID=676 RepID=UPI001C9D78F7|nr:hypothetical protein [Vibrio fluvialis]MBY8073495.1 hypothetical protein [Vibrio fluvialis]
MNNKNALMLLLPAISLAGCGEGGSDGSGSTTPVTNYTFEFISLYETERDTLPSGCAIYSQEAIYTTDNNGNAVIDKYKLVLGAKSELSNLKVLIHDKTGKVLREYTPTSSSAWSSERLRFAQSLVPKDGYVTVSHQVIVPGSANIVSVTSATYQKSLLTTNMKFSTIASPVSTNISSCTKESRISYSKKKKTIDDDGLGFGVFGFNTPELRFWSVSPQNIEFETSNLPVLAMRYEFLDGDTKENINSTERQKLVRDVVGYRFRSSNDLSSSSSIFLRSDGYLSEADWRLDDTNAVLDSAQLWVRYNNRAYFWQNLPLSDGSFYYANEVGRSYVLKMEGSAFGWEVLHNTRLDGSGDWNQTPVNDVTYRDVMSSLPIPDVKTPEVLPCTSCYSGYAINSYTGASDDYDVQRTFVLMTRQGQQLRQVIYSAPGSQVTLPSYSDTLVNSLWSADLSISKVSLLKGSSIVEGAFIRQHSNAWKQTYGNSQYFEDPNVDALGMIATQDTKQVDISKVGTESYVLLTK